MLNTVYANNVVPTDAKIYYENGVPYLEYKGIATDWSGDKIEISLPKINLFISQIEYSEESIRGIYDRLIELNVTFSGTNYNKLENVLSTKTIERTMTKEQIEKELGYKIKIKD